MAVTAWGQVYIQATAPQEDPVQVGSLWIDTSGTATLKVCTSVSPFTFSAISGGAVAWGAITGTLSDQTDLQTALNAKVASTRQVISGAGLSGGGDLSADRTLAVGAGTGISVGADDVALDTTHARNVDHTAVTLTAGDGLTGGGDISASRSFSVGAGTGITVNANDVAVNQAALKLDDWAAPDDNTDLDASATKHGLMPKWTSALISSLLDLISSTRGAILYRGATAWAALSPGTSGHALTSNGAGADPSYQAVAGASVNSFTPTMAFGGSATGITYATQNGYYSKVGQHVHVFGRITLTSNGSGTGVPTLTNLPFTVENLTNGNALGTCLGLAGMSGNFHGLVLRANPNTTTAEFLAQGLSTAVALSESNLLDAFSCDFDLHYRTA